MTSIYRPLVFAVAGIMVLTAVVTLPKPDCSDARVYYDTAQRLAHHQPIYVEAPRRNPYDVTNTFLYPPVFAALIRPAAYLSWDRFLGAWYLLLSAAFVGLASCLVLLFVGLDRWMRAPVKLLGVSMAIVLLTPGVVASLAVGNADLIVWALAAGALVLGESWPMLAATFMKLYPGPAWGVSMLREKRRPSWYVIAGLAAIVVYTFKTVDVPEWRAHGLPATVSGNFTFYNWSLSTLPLRWLAPGDRLLAHGWRVYLSTMSIAAPVIAAWFGRKLRVRAHVAVVLLVSTAFAPLCWWYRLPIAILLVVAAAVADKRDAEARLTSPTGLPLCATCGRLKSQHTNPLAHVFGEKYKTPPHEVN